MRMNIETPELREPIESYITANGQIRRPTSEDEKEGRKLSSSCRTARNMASSLDKVNAKLSLPKEISENRFVEMVTEACKLFFLPYSSQRYTESKPTGPMREYEVEAEVDGRG